MKRFDWPRLALLFGLFLADKVEGSVYHWITVYGWNFLDRPIVLAFIAVTVLLMFAAVKHKLTIPILEHNRIQSPNKRNSQFVFLLAIMAFAILLFLDARQYQFFTTFYPQFVAVGGLCFMTPLALLMMFKKTPSTVLFDNERASFSQSDEAPKSERYHYWHIGLLLGLILLDPVYNSKEFSILFINVAIKFIELNYFETLQIIYSGIYNAGGMVAVYLLFRLSVHNQTPSTTFQDDEITGTPQTSDIKSAEHYPILFLGLIGAFALFGFAIGYVGFTYTFLRYKAGQSHLASALYAIILSIILVLLSWFLSWTAPEGLLQYFFKLPWPLGPIV